METAVIPVDDVIHRFFSLLTVVSKDWQKMVVTVQQWGYILQKNTSGIGNLTETL